MKKWSVFALVLFIVGSICLAANAQLISTGAGKKASGGGGGVTFSLAFTDSRGSTSTTATVTYNVGGDPGCGAADTNRIVAAGIMRRITSSTAPSSVTIGGVSATQVSGAFVVNGGVMQTDIWYATVTSGTTCTVVVAWDAGASVLSDSAVVLYRIITATSAPTAAVNATASNAAVVLPSYTVPSGGASMNFLSTRASSTDLTSWTNATVDVDTDVGGREYSGAHVSTAGSVTVTADCTPGTCNQENSAVAAAWGP